MGESESGQIYRGPDAEAILLGTAEAQPMTEISYTDEEGDLYIDIDGEYGGYYTAHEKEGGFYSEVYTTGILHGIQYYINGHADEIKNNDYIKDGITCMLAQFDSYMEEAGLENWADVSGKFTQISHGGDWMYGWIPRSDRGSTDREGQGTLDLLMAQEWVTFMDNNPSVAEIEEKLQKISSDLEFYYGQLKNKDKYIQELIDDLFEKLDIDLEGLTIEDIDTIYFALEDALDSYEYVSPRIAYVVRHWYKDIIFEIPEAEELFSEKQTESAYIKSKKEIRLPYTLPEEKQSDDLDITIVLNVEGKDQKDNVYTQWRQPYVVKGDVVYLDGEKVEDTGLEDGKKTIKTAKGEYTIGDGYRTMKKLMTQGQYYVLDGSRQTAKSILWCKKLEHITSGTVRVKNGRILSISTSENMNEEVDQETAISNALVTTAQGTVTKVGETVLPETGEVIYEYNVRKSAVPYVSVGNKYENYSDSEVIEASKKSVEYINGVLDQLGVTTKRLPISFDNKTINGDVVTLTAFGLLEGMHTEPAQYIYRDFKEMLIEFGYYTKAEFESLNKDVLKWFIPEYTVNTEAESLYWRQNKEDDSLDYGAIIYPIDESEFKKGNDGTKNGNSGTASESTNEENKEGEEEDKDILGIRPGMGVIAPGNCTVETIDGKVVLTFDGISQPEIGVIDRYQMIIEGVTATASGTVEVGDSIGTTTGEKVKVILKNNLGGYVDNIEDYMRPDVANKWDGNFSEEFLCHLATIEGMPRTSDSAFTYENGGVNWGAGEDAVTVGPGLYLLYNADKFPSYVDTSHVADADYWNKHKDKYSFDKEATVDVYLQLLEEIKGEIEGLGLPLSQQQFEALVELRWQQGGRR